MYPIISNCRFNVCFSAMDLRSTLLFFLGLRGICAGLVQGELSHTVTQILLDLWHFLKQTCLLCMHFIHFWTFYISYVFASLTPLLYTIEADDTVLAELQQLVQMFCQSSVFLIDVSSSQVSHWFLTFLGRKNWKLPGCYCDRTLELLWLSSIK